MLWRADMRRRAITVAAPAPLGPVIAYYSVPFPREVGRPAFLVTSRTISAFGVRAVSRFELLSVVAGRHSSPPSALGAVRLRFSTIPLLAFLLFPQALANVLADAFKGAI